MTRRHHILSLTVLISIASLLLPLTASAATTGVLIYTVAGTPATVTIDSCDGACPATLTIPATIADNPVTSIGDGAFEDASSLTSITIPSSVTSIGNNAFRRASSLTSITIPSSVTSIGDEAFNGASNLTSITIPSSVTSIGNNAFYDASSLTSINVDALNANYSSASPGVLFNKLATTLIAYPSGNTTLTYTIPSTVTSIGNGAFSGATGLTSVTIPSSVTSIGDEAFNGASNLTSITIPSSVTSIGDGAFYGASSLTSVFYMGDAPSTVGSDTYSGTHDDLVSYRFVGTTWPVPVPDLWQDRLTGWILFPATPPAPTAVAGVESATITSTPATIGEAPTSYTITASPGAATCTAGVSGVCTITGLTAGTPYTFTSVAHNADPTPSGRSAASLSVTPTAPVTPVAPVNTFTMKILKRSAASITTQLNLPGAGRVVLVGTTSLSTPRATELAKRAATLIVCTARKTVAKAGKLTIICRLTAKARAARKTQSLKVRLVTTFTPTGGTAFSVTRTLVLKKTGYRPEPVTG